MNFVIVRFIYTAISFIISLLLFRAYKKGSRKNKNLRDFSIFFLILGLYLPSTTTYIFTGDMQMVALSYDVAVALYFMLGAIGLKIALSFLELSKKTSNFLVGLILFVGIGVVIYQLIIPNVPEITDIPGFILWNVGIPIQIITGLVGFVVSHTWAYAFLPNFENADNTRSKIKSLLIMISSSAMGFSALTYFYPSELSLYLSYVFGFITLFGFLTVAILRLKK